MNSTAFLLGIDACGFSGSVALGRLTAGAIEVLGQIELEGRSYSSTLVAAVGELLTQAGSKLSQLDAIVAVSGPGSFTGVRIGLSTVKGLAEPARIPVAIVSRLEVLAAKAGCAAAALDAHRGEIFLRIEGAGKEAKELLAGAEELATIGSAPARIAVCDDAAERLLRSAWPLAEVLRSAPPTATDALKIAAARIEARDFVDLALLDGHYLRRSDAEIFGKSAEAHPA